MSMGRTSCTGIQIVQVFPGVKCIKNCNDPVPCFIKHVPDVVLNVVSSNVTDRVCVNSSMGAPSMVPTVALNCAKTVDGTDARADRTSTSSSVDTFVEDLRIISASEETPIHDIGDRDSSTDPSVLPPSPLSKVETTSKTALAFIEALKRASKKTREADDQALQQENNPKIAYMIKLLEASDTKQEEMRQLQKQALDKQEEMKQLALKHHQKMKNCKRRQAPNRKR